MNAGLNFRTNTLTYKLKEFKNNGNPLDVSSFVQGLLENGEDSGLPEDAVEQDLEQQNLKNVLEFMTKMINKFGNLDEEFTAVERDQMEEYYRFIRRNNDNSEVQKFLQEHGEKLFEMIQWIYSLG